LVKPVFQHITVPVDGSTTSGRGVTFALELARDGGHVSFCSVVDPMLAYAPAAYGVALDPGPMIDVLDEDADGFCRSAHDEAKQCAVVADMTILHGQSIGQIAEFAAHNGSDAIVIGTHGRSAVVRAMLGSVAEGVLRQMDIPVVSVHQHDVMRTGPIAVALDPSPAAQAALELAIRIAGTRGMQLLLVHVKSRVPNGAAMTRLLDEAVVRARSHDIPAQIVVDEGGAADELLQAADAHDCCMIVMGTHGRESVMQLVLGSVAAAVVERARVPVVTVRRAA
jgi:nucleotide-binding universal stress UspA family protein